MFMKQQTVQSWQHSPPKTQVTSNPEKAVSKALKQTESLSFTNKDLMGLSWILFEERD